MECTRQGSPLDVKPSDLELESRLWSTLINNYVNECGPQSTVGVKVAWLQVNDIMLPVVKNMKYLIGYNSLQIFAFGDPAYHGVDQEKIAAQTEIGSGCRSPIAAEFCVWLAEIVCLLFLLDDIFSLVSFCVVNKCYGTFAVTVRDVNRDDNNNNI